MRKRPKSADLDAMKVDQEPWVLIEQSQMQPLQKSVWVNPSLHQGKPDGLEPPPKHGVKAGSTASNQGKGSDPAKSLIEPLLVKADVACFMLGSINPRTLKRMEDRGLIRPLTGLLRHKLYPVDELRSLVANLKNWTP